MLIKYYTRNFLFVFCFTFIFKILFYLFNYNTFSLLSFKEVAYALVWGVRFDVAVSSMIVLPVLLLSFLLNLIYSKQTIKFFLPLFVILLIVMQSSDIMYFMDSGRHLTYEIQSGSNDFYALLSTSWNRFYFVVIPTISFALLALFLASKIKTVTWKKEPLIKNVLFSLGILAWTVFSIRGSFKEIPLSVFHAYKIGDPRLGPLALNGAYSIIRSSVKLDTVERVRLPDRHPNKITNSMQSLYSKIKPNSVNSRKDYTKYNVVFLLLESWSADAMASYGYHRETTPFFDKLRSQSLTTTEMIASGHRTPEGVFASFCSTQNPLGKMVANSQLMDFSYYCLPQILRENKWKTAFFQGTHKDMVGVGPLAQKLGVEDSFGKEDMPDKGFSRNSWGAHDNELYEFVFSKISRYTQPFFISINTNSTHDVLLPKGVTSKFGMTDNLSRRDSLLYYADTELKKFIEAYIQEKKFSPTIFIAMADHTAGEHRSRFDHYRIPFFIFVTDQQKLHKNLSIIASQRDVAPTILDIIGLSVPKSFSGTSLLSSKQDRFADFYHNGILGWITNNRLVETSIVDNKIISCGIYNKNRTFSSLPCDDNDIKNSQRAMDFTSYSQELLFSGNTTLFKSFIRSGEKKVLLRLPGQDKTVLSSQSTHTTTE